MSTIELVANRAQLALLELADRECKFSVNLRHLFSAGMRHLLGHRLRDGIALVVAYVVTSVVLTVPTPTSAQGAKVGVVDAVEGVVTVARQAAESRSLGAKEDVMLQDRIMTASESMARIRFTAGATAEMRERSVMTISEEQGALVLHLDEGALYYRGSRDPSRQDGSQTIRTANAIVRAAGSVSVGVTRASEVDTLPVTLVCVMEGNGFAAALGGSQVEVPEQNCAVISGNAFDRIFPIPQPIPLPYLSQGLRSSSAFTRTAV